MSHFIPVAQPALHGNEKAYVLDCLETNWISSTGQYIDRFERQFAHRLGVPHAISCCNGTVALHLALLALGIGPGDEVLVPSLTFVASANAVVYCGATPVFVDCLPETWNLDPNSVEQNLSPRSKAVIAVHLYGQPVDLGRLLPLCQERGLFLVEDAAEAHGALYQGQPVGGLADIGTFSFYGNKIITTGEGGMVVTRHAHLAERVTRLKSQGVDPRRRYWFTEVGYNYRMTNIAAALGLAQLEKLDDYLAERDALARAYEDRLGDFSLQRGLEGNQPARWMISVLLAEDLAGQRDDIMAEMLADGIETRPLFPPVHLLPPYVDDARAPLPVTESLSARGITLPTWVGLTIQDIERVCDAFKRCVAACSNTAA